MSPDPVPAGIPLTSGGGAPEPWNQNDVHIWIDLILKYACIEAPGRNTLQASEFALSQTAQKLRPTYHDEEEKERAIIEKNSEYYKLLETCLQKLHERGVLTVGELSDSSDNTRYKVYHRTELMTNKVCRVIKKNPEMMHDINSILSE